MSHVCGSNSLRSCIGLFSADSGFFDGNVGFCCGIGCNLSTTAAPRSPGCAPQPWPPCWPPPGCVGWRVVGWRTPTAVVDPGSPVNACVRLRCQQERRNGKRDLLSHTTRESSCVHACVLMLARLARGAPAEDCARPRRGPGNNIYMILFNNIDNN